VRKKVSVFALPEHKAAKASVNGTVSHKWGCGLREEARH